VVFWFPLKIFSFSLALGVRKFGIIKRTDQNQPFCLFVCFHEPHEPISSPPELVEKYRAWGATKPGEAEYYANVENMDHAVGRLVAYLKKEGQWDNTLTLFTSDNGPETLNRYQGAERSHGSPGNLRAMKLWLYEGGIRVPGIVVWPKTIKPNQVSPVPVGTIDFFPTLCTLAQVELPVDRCYDGIDLVPLFQGKELERTKPIFWYYINALGEPRVAMRDGDWKLIATLKGNPQPGPGQTSHASEWFAAIKTAQLDRFELYNLVNDRQEQRDLSSHETERIQTMQRQMETLFHEIQQEAPLW